MNRKCWQAALCKLQFRQHPQGGSTFPHPTPVPASIRALGKGVSRAEVRVECALHKGLRASRYFLPLTLNTNSAKTRSSGCCGMWGEPLWNGKRAGTHTSGRAATRVGFTALPAQRVHRPLGHWVRCGCRKARLHSQICCHPERGQSGLRGFH